MSRTIFAANWKMHHGPAAARDLVRAVLSRVRSKEGRTLLFFPPTVSLPAVAAEVGGRKDAAAGVQNVYWESRGAFTGEVSAPIAAEAGATWALIGHSERRHKFGETDEETGRKVRAVLAAGLAPMLCVGEKIEERRSGQTEAVVLRQLEAGLGGLDAATLSQVTIARFARGLGRASLPAPARASSTAARSTRRTRRNCWRKRSWTACWWAARASPPTRG